MREPTKEEMIEGIRQAVAREFDLMDCGRLEAKDMLFGALHSAARDAIEKWIKQNEAELTNAVVALAGKRG